MIKCYCINNRSTPKRGADDGNVQRARPTGLQAVQGHRPGRQRRLVNLPVHSLRRQRQDLPALQTAGEVRV